MSNFGSHGRPKGARNHVLSDVRIPKIARWSIAGFTDVRISEMLGLTAVGVQKIKQLPEYQEVYQMLLASNLKLMDEALAGHADAIREEFRVGVPAAVRCLVEAAQQRKDLKAAIEASKELLKRDPDRTLPETKEENVPFAIPDEILNDAIVAGNEIAKNYNASPSSTPNETDPTKVN